MRRFLRRLFRLLLLGLVIVLGVVVYNTATYPSRQIEVEPVPQASVSNAVVERLARAVRFPTVSREGWIDTLAFRQLDAFLTDAFPLVDSLLDHRRINQFSHLYRWPGKKQGLDPILLMGHLDVVPAEGEQLSRWSQPPFSGLVDDTFIWGRGTLDDKGACLAILETVEQLLREEYVPERTLYLAFGHDEEVSGVNGAQAIARQLEKEGLDFAYILDEGMVIVEEALPGLDPPFAGIGVAEKGYATLELLVELEEGGHSSMPPRETAIGILSKAVYQLQENPLPAETGGVVGEMFAYLGPEMNLPLRAVFANRWLTGGLLKSQLSNQPSANAMIRTTTAPTVLKGGVKDNVLPLSASARINFRILPGNTVERTREQVAEIINDPRVAVSVTHPDFASDPSPVSGTDGFGFHTVQKTIKEVFPGAVVAPSLVIAATDARHYTGLSAQVLRFFPVQLTNADLKRLHGIDERISIEGYKQAIRFYRQLILNSTR